MKIKKPLPLLQEQKKEKSLISKLEQCKNQKDTDEGIKKIMTLVNSFFLLI